LEARVTGWAQRARPPGARLLAESGCPAGSEQLVATRLAQPVRRVRDVPPGRMIYRPGSSGRYPAGTVCSIAGSATTRRAGGEPPARICLARPDMHSVLDRWERLAGRRPNLTPRRQCQRMGVPRSVLERCGSRAESVAKASRAGGAARACGPVCGPGARWGLASDAHRLQPPCLNPNSPTHPLSHLP
jgi:hypothetical protein